MSKENLLEFYTKYGVEEYYSYDPDDNTFIVHVRQGNELVRLEGLPKWTSPLLKISFELTDYKLKIYDPEGQIFLSFRELGRKVRRQKMEFEEELSIEKRRLQFLLEYEKSLRQEAEAERLKAQVEAERAQAAETRQKLLEEKLRALGIDPSSM